MMKEVLHRIAILLTGVIVGILLVIVIPLGITGCSSDNSFQVIGENCVENNGITECDDPEEAIEVPPSSSSGCELVESSMDVIDTMYVMDEAIIDTSSIPVVYMICDGDTVDIDVPEYDSELN